MITIKKQSFKINKYFFVPASLIALLFFISCVISSTNSYSKAENLMISAERNNFNDTEVKEIIVWKNFSKENLGNNSYAKQQLILETKPNSVSNKDTDDIGIDEFFLIKLSKIKKKQLYIKFAFKVLSNSEEPHTLLVSLISKATLKKKYIPITDVKQDSDWYVARAFLNNLDLKELNLYKLNFEARNNSTKNTTFAYLKDIEIVLL